MINIYSIKEVIEASNNILNRTKLKTKVTSHKKFYHKKNIILKKDKPLILTDIVSNENKIETKKHQPDLKKNTKENEIIKPIKNDKVVDELYLRYGKKIKKNTLKLIFELQKEVSNLNKEREFLKISNKQAKVQISNINNEFEKIKILNKKLNNEKIVHNKKINELSDNIKSSREKINSLNQSKIELEKEIINYKAKEEISSKKIYDISKVENKNKFFQEENLRIGSELIEVKKKHDILKKEIEKYEIQKSSLISKINSVNEALSNTNILTNVFENKVENKVKIIDHNKIEKKNILDLDEQIKNIFSDKIKY